LKIIQQRTQTARKEQKNFGYLFVEATDCTDNTDRVILGLLF